MASRLLLSFAVVIALCSGAIHRKHDALIKRENSHRYPQKENRYNKDRFQSQHRIKHHAAKQMSEYDQMLQHEEAQDLLSDWNNDNDYQQNEFQAYNNYDNEFDSYNNLEDKITINGFMRINKYYHNAAFVAMEFRQVDQGIDSNQGSSVSGCGISPIIDSNPGGCISFINDMNNLNKYYFGREKGRNTIRTRQCNGCINTWDSKQTKIISCNDNLEFGQRFPNRIKTGLRYIIEYDPNNNKPLIVGYEFLCTNPNNYDGWHTIAGFSNNININRYDWSPWFICPKGKKIKITETLNTQQCETNVFVDTRIEGCNPNAIVGICTFYDCYKSFKYKWQQDSGIKVQCVV